MPAGDGQAGDLPGLTFFRGRVALWAILRALGVGRGDEVAIQAFTCLAVPEAVLATGARPLFVDVEPHGVNMSPDDLRAKLTARTRAIVVQHTFGAPARVRELLGVAKEGALPVVEDCCHTLASTVDGVRVGAFGVASFFSYEWGKPIVAGIGGSAIVHDPEVASGVHRIHSSLGTPDLMTEARLAVQFAAFGLVARPRLYWPVKTLFHKLARLGAVAGNYNELGRVSHEFGWRMARLPARRLRARLRELERQVSHSRWVAEQYRERLRRPGLEHVEPPAGSVTVWARYPLLSREKATLLRAARRANVELAEWYATPVHPLADDELARVHYTPGTCPHAETRSAQVVTLPTHPRVRQRDIDRAIALLA
jgi:perosamine synthetase